MSKEPTKTWDGKPVSIDPPYGASVVVYRRAKTDYEFLILHRKHRGVDYDGEWAWTPPSGARLPGEDIDRCATRELKEETGLELNPRKTDFGDYKWYVYIAEVDTDCDIILDSEHDRYEWLSLNAALERCQPKKVHDSILAVGRDIGL